MGRKIKKFISKLLTLSYPSRVFVFLIVLILLAVLPLSIVEKTHDFSICSKIFGDYCYSVGITRGISCLLKGDFQKAISYNFLSIFVLIIIFILIVRDLIKLKK